MTKYVPPSFNRARVLDGLHKAMGFGEPNSVDDKATFFFSARPASATPADGAGVPFNPDERPANTGSPKKTVACAVEYFDAAGQAQTFGDIRPSRVKITLLAPEWDQVKDFAYVVCAGDKYIRSTLQPVDALGSLDIYTVWATAESER